jgi:hypothetical protein
MLTKLKTPTYFPSGLEFQSTPWMSPLIPLDRVQLAVAGRHASGPKLCLQLLSSIELHPCNRQHHAPF